MANSYSQNPRNKVGRNSGAGPGGLSQVVPTQREAERGLQPITLDDDGAGWMARLGLGLGVVGLVSAGAAVFLAQRARQRTLRGRLERLVGLR